MYVPLEISVKNVEKTEKLEELIKEKMNKLERVCDHIAGCHVSVEKTQEHVKTGTPYRARIDLTVPPSHELVAKQEPGQGEKHDGVETVIRKAFTKAERQLKKLVDKQHEASH
ncbi:MAG: ribosome hibernation-promoting factor, HPF/YfiA family [Sediminispirochaetaceae bacterium]